MLAQPQRHRDTEKAQSHPPTSQTRRHEDTKRAQSRPPATEKPQITQINADSPRGFTTWRGPRSDERGPRHSSSSFQGREGHAFRSDGEDARRNRRAPSAAAGGKSGCDERLRSEQTGLPPVGGDRQIAARSAVNPRHCRIVSATTSLRLCAFASLRFSWCFLLVSWCLGGSPGCVVGKFEIRNPKSEIR